MRNRITVVISLLLCCAAGGGAIWANSGPTARGRSWQDERGGGQTSNPLVSVKEKARAAKSNDEAAIRALADEIFSMFNFDQAPAGMDDAIKERLVRAEIKYRQGRAKGSQEFRVAHMVNLLAHKLGAPDYARTNVLEVRRLRMSLLPYTSGLRAQSPADETRKGEKRSASMSPLEAFVVAVSLLQQKRFNVEYQLTNDEWVALHGGKRSAGSGAKFLEEMKARRRDSRRTDEIDEAIGRGFAAMSPSQILGLPEELLNTLGVERQEGR